MQKTQQKSQGSEQVTDLYCPGCVGDSKSHVRLWSRVYLTDENGLPVPKDQQGPYLQHWFGTGRDYGDFESGGVFVLRRYQGRLIVQPSALRYNNSVYSHDQPLLPDFGYGEQKQFWICQACFRMYGDDRDMLLTICLLAAEAEGNPITNE